MQEQRIQKFLANQGVASRRTIESWIKSKRLKINGKLALLGMQINGTEQFTLDEQNLLIDHINTNNYSDSLIYNSNSNLSSNLNSNIINNIDTISPNLNINTKLLLYHKPTGSICSKNDPIHHHTVYEDLPKITNGRWISIGRLDLNTSGLLLFTNNGDLAHRLMHPKFNQEREYLVRVYGKKIGQQQFSLFTRGVLLNDGIAKFKNITLLNNKSKSYKKTNDFNHNCNNWYKVILTQGKNKEIRRLFATQNLIVNRLIRIRFGNIILPKDLKPRQYKYLDIAELSKI